HAIGLGEHLEDADVGDVELVDLPHGEAVGGEDLVDDLAGPLEVVAHERGGVAGQPQNPGEVLAGLDPGGHRLRCRAGGGVQPERRPFDGVERRRHRRFDPFGVVAEGGQFGAGVLDVEGPAEASPDRYGADGGSDAGDGKDSTLTPGDQGVEVAAYVLSEAAGEGVE